MTIVGGVRLDIAREQARRLEEVIRDARAEHADAHPQSLAQLLEPVLSDLYAVRAQIDAALGLDEVRVGAAALQLRFKGRNVGDGRGPAQMVGTVLASLQRGARQASGFLQTGAAVGRRIAEDVALASELDVLAFGYGSLTVAIAARIEQLSLTETGLLAERGLSMIISAARWAQAEADDAALDRIAADAQVRRQLVNRVREIAPGRRADFESLELSGPVLSLAGADSPNVTLTPVAFLHASAYLRRRTKEPVNYSGRLVMVDVEKDVFDLRIPGRRVHCHFGEALKAEAKALVENYVEVRGVGSFELESEDPYRIDAEFIRRLSLEEARALES